jgi:hypothetical protein
MQVTLANPRIAAEYEPFAVVAPWNRPHFDLAPFGLAIPERNLFDPTRLGSEPFLGLLQAMDAMTFGPEGMPMARWVFYNCSELPGGIMGFGRAARELPEAQRRAFGLASDYDGLVPFSMFIAIPMLPAGDWMGHNLCSLNGVFPDAGLAGLASVTKAFGLTTYRARVLYGATQWRSRALHIHVKFGLLDLITAYTPAHSEHMTLTYRVEVSLDGLRAACGDPSDGVARPAPTFWLDAEDEASAARLQDDIERGARYQIVARPERRGERTLIPRRERP